MRGQTEELAETASSLGLGIVGQLITLISSA